MSSNELVLKKSLQEYLTANTGYSWYADSSPKAYVNIFQGELYNSDRIDSKHSPSIIFVEFVFITTNKVFDVLDDSLLTAKSQLDHWLRMIHRSGIPVNLNTYSGVSIGKGLSFKSWNKEITTESVSESEQLHKGILSMQYSLVFSGLA